MRAIRHAHNQREEVKLTLYAQVRRWFRGPEAPMPASDAVLQLTHRESEQVVRDLLDDSKPGSALENAAERALAEVREGTVRIR